MKTTQEREKTTLDSMGPGRSKTYRKKDVSQHAKSEKVVGKQKESQRRSKKSYEGGDSGEEAGDEENILVGEAGVQSRLNRLNDLVYTRIIYLCPHCMLPTFWSMVIETYTWMTSFA